MKSLIYFFIRFSLGLLPFSIPDWSFVFKWAWTLFYLRIYKRFKKGRLDFYDIKARGQPEKVGFIEHPTEAKLESPCSHAHLQKAEDKIFCYGVNSKSEFFVASVGRLPHGEAEAFVLLRLSNGKTYRLEKTRDYQQSTGIKRAFSCGGLQMYYLCAMRRWRIFYSGYLKESSDENPNLHRMVYVKFSFLWRASSDVYDNLDDMNEFAVAESVAKANWKSLFPPVNRFHKLLDFYGQSGVVLGTVCVEDGVQDHEIYLFGEKIRYRGNLNFTKGAEFSMFLGYVLKNGTFVHVGTCSAPHIAKDMSFGFVVKPTSEIKSIERLKLSEDVFENGAPEDEGTITAGRLYNLSVSAIKPIHETNNQVRLEMNEVEFNLNGTKGFGIFIKEKVFLTSPTRAAEIVPRTTIPDLLFPMVVLFSEDLCNVPELTGGKGSSLGRLTQLGKQAKSFAVPSGMVITTSAYKEFLTEEVLQEIRHLEGTLYGKVKGDPKEACKKVHAKIIATKMHSHVRDRIVKSLKQLFGDGYPQKKFAVRSSATGEDTDQMSAAGQMDTFLAVSGLSNIILAVKKCWASQFSFTAVQYKRRYGQCLNGLMAVVVQEMVPCEVAGVLFTCDPVTGSPTKMSIAANFGLGDSVVSGSEEPDSIELHRHYNDELEIASVTVGCKMHRIVVTDDGTDVNENSEDERRESCLSNETALELGKIAIQVENHYRSKRDIEWGIYSGTIHLFQCRPVTSGSQETDFEIEHEFDGALRVENDFFSVCNIGEVMPGATSTLGLETNFRSWNQVFQGENVSDFQLPIRARYFQLGWMSMSYHGMFIISEMFRALDPDNLREMDMALMIGMFGRVLDDKAVYAASAERYAGEPVESFQSSGCLDRVKNFWIRQKILYLTPWILAKTKKAFDKYRVPVEKCKASIELFNAMLSRCSDLCDVSLCHLMCTEGSTKWNNYMMTALLKGNKDKVNDAYHDFSNLITVRGDVESADVPLAMQALALNISKCKDPDEFKEMKIEDALRWLKDTSTTAGKSFKDFMDRHGHRCLNEMDIYSVPWGDDPRSLIKILQGLVGTVSKTTGTHSNESILKLISEMKTPVSFRDKLKLLLSVPFARQAVRNREWGKSLLVKGIDRWRKAYRHLARLMVAEGRIANEDLLFFMTLEEIKELLEDRSPRILTKAYHRMRLHPKLNTYVYPEIMQGFPKPINFEDDSAREEGLFSMKGIPVSQGVIKGYLRVAVSLQDAAGLKPGEILLAYSTDIGWSPYFPTLAGVATELGGLISHGAVVSREYGLPCVAGLHGATRRFKTGDYVYLDGNKGILQKLQDSKDRQQ